MAVIGSWGNAIIFRTSDSRILTFSNFSRTVSSSWANHSRIGRKDKSEFVRPDLQKITFTIVLDATLGVKPRETLEMITGAVEKGTVNTLVIGGKKIGSSRWAIKSTSEAWDYILQEGQLVHAKVSLTMEEYL